MSPQATRREFIRTTAGGGLVAAAGLGIFGKLPQLSAAEVALDSAAVRFDPEIEPLVRLLEETPRERLLEEVGARVKSGTTYREVLSALLLAGIRNIQPRPVGFKFHAVLVVNSAHLASQNSPDEDRWLPVFWALDQFKVSQARDVEQGDWTMPAVDEKSLPEPAKAAEVFAEGMDAWDEAKVDVAAAALARSGRGSGELFDLFARYGARDYRDIGHKAIYVANSWRTLQTMGWQHAEPVLRSLAYAMLMHTGGNPAERDSLADRPGRKNLIRRNELRADWATGHVKPETTTAMHAVLRSGDWDEAAQAVVEMINLGSSPRPLWDAFFQSAAEMMMRSPGIVSLHACTTTNALFHAFVHAGDDATRRFLMLQNASFLTFFRNDSGAVAGVEIDKFEAAPADGGPAEIFEIVGKNNTEAAARTLGYLEAGGDPRTFLDLAQRLIYLKGRDSHDYKYSSAIIEDFRHISPGFRNRFLASSVNWLKGSSLDDSPLVARSRAAL
jgi:hypothetical protein